MKYYKDANNNVYAYEGDGSQDEYILPGLVKITQADAESFRNQPSSAIPTIVTMAQARQALLQQGHLQHVSDYINGMTGAVGEAARIDWEFRTTVERSHSLVALIQAELLLTDTQVDELFTLASTL